MIKAMLATVMIVLLVGEAAMLARDFFDPCSRLRSEIYKFKCHEKHRAVKQSMKLGKDHHYAQCRMVDRRDAAYTLNCSIPKYTGGG